MPSFILSGAPFCYDSRTKLGTDQLCACARLAKLATVLSAVAAKEPKAGKTTGGAVLFR